MMKALDEKMLTVNYDYDDNCNDDGVNDVKFNDKDDEDIGDDACDDASDDASDDAGANDRPNPLPHQCRHLAALPCGPHTCISTS